MTLTLRCPQCDAPVHIIDDNGVVDGTKTRWEEYECEREMCGHTFTQTLEPRR